MYGWNYGKLPPGSLLCVRYRILIGTVAVVAYLIFESGPLRKNPDTPEGVSGFLVQVFITDLTNMKIFDSITHIINHIITNINERQEGKSIQFST